MQKFASQNAPQALPVRKEKKNGTRRMAQEDFKYDTKHSALYLPS
jgi:hypothetical protein